MSMVKIKNVGGENFGNVDGENFADVACDTLEMMKMVNRQR